MKSSKLVWALLPGVLLACSSAPFGGENERVGSTPSAAEISAPGQLTVMSRNTYLGADVDVFMAAQSAEEVPVLVATAWAQLIGNDSAARASAIAEEIAQNMPALLGLQETAIFRRFPASGGAPEEIDFLAMLESELAARGLDYRVVVTQPTSDVFMPLLAGFDDQGAPILDFVQMIDRDAMLARGGVSTSQVTSGRYVQGLPISVGGTSVEIVRGWTSAVVTTGAGSFRFVSTHLEDDFVPEVQLAQADELLRMLAPETLPTLLVGDMNSPADGTGTPTYGYLVSAGFTDAWKRANPRDAGYTCCYGGDLHEPGALTERLDLVLVRWHGHAIKGPFTAKTVGTAMTAAGVWPSDHAGVVATFRFP